MTIVFPKVTLVLLLGCYAFAASAACPIDTTQKDSSKTGTVKFGTTFYSNDAFAGRTNKAAIPFLASEIKYTFDSGIYIGGLAYILPQNKKNKVDGGEFNIGYGFDITDALSGDVSYHHFFYNLNSSEITSAMSSTISASLEYEIEDIITPFIGFDYVINRAGINNDRFLNFGVSHKIALSERGNLSLSPTLALNAGTQYFYDAYLQRRLFKTSSYNTEQQQVVGQFENSVGQFVMLDYELSLPFKYESKHFTFELAPEYDVLQNDFKSNALSKSLGVSATPGVFFVTAGIFFNF